VSKHGNAENRNEHSKSGTTVKMVLAKIDGNACELHSGSLVGDDFRK
jgi:hypothetical protein